MRIAVWALLIVSFVSFLVGVAGNLMELTGASGIILWPPLAWWRAAVYCVALAMALSLIRHHHSHKA